MKWISKKYALTIFAALLLAGPTALLAAELKVAAIFSDHMVLQRDKPVPIWGWSDAGERITVKFAGQTASATANADGKWMVKMAPFTASAESRELRIMGAHHPAPVVVQDVLVGEVWLGSGQSNMQMPLRDARDFPTEKAAANWPQIRMFTESSKCAPTPQTNTSGQWKVCLPENVDWFSATLYFFGRELHRELKLPVGLVHSSVGGTQIESWLAEDAQACSPETKTAMEYFRKAYEKLGTPEALAEHARKIKDFEDLAAKAKAEGLPAPQKVWGPMDQRDLQGGLGHLFNGKIAPLIPYALRGALWYQGESNASVGQAKNYQYQMALLVSDWRARWGEEFPFAWVQLPNFEPGENIAPGWPLVREAMLKTLRLPHTGMAITIDIGEANNIHPKNKQEVGRRLALWALGEVYGVKVPSTSGPLPSSHEVRGSEMVLSFKRADGGLQAKDGELKGFFIAGDDHQWKPAQARIVKDQVIASSPEVTKPVAVRYAWAADPECNLYNGAGLPASPFRTDDWPVPDAPVTAAPASVLVALEKTLTVDGSHLIVPVANHPEKEKQTLLGIYDGNALVQSFNVSLPQGSDAFWLAAYPLEHFGLKGKQIKIAPVDNKPALESCRAAFDRIKIGSESDALSASDYTKPYRNQFHASTRRGWNNDPNGMVFQNGKFHLYYQYNPLSIFWGNLHWGHLESTDLIHWKEQPIALYQNNLKEQCASGGGFIDFNNSAGLGKDTLFVAATITGRGECVFYSKDGGLTFTELPENPVVKHKGSDPKIFWYQPEQKWVMAVFDWEACFETEACSPAQGLDVKERSNGAHNHIAFFESKNLRQWNRTGAFTDPDRAAVFECPEMYELPVAGKPGESRWILMGAQNRYFIGQFDGKTFHKESGPLGTRHGAFYAAQTFSDLPDKRRIQIGWVQTDCYLKQFPDQMVNQAFSLPHELTLRETGAGLRLFFSPVKETEKLRCEVLAEGKNLTLAQANELLQKCKGELSETLIEFADAGPEQLVINGLDASFNGRTARIFTDRTFNEIYTDDGISCELRKRLANKFDSTETRLTAGERTIIHSLKIFRLKSIWPK